MTILFLILIVFAAVALGFIVLVQNPKGGGLSGTVAGINNQFMGVKQTNDVLERGTWLFSTIIALLCIFSSFFMTSSAKNSVLDKVSVNQTTNSPAPQQNAPAQQQPAPVQQPAPAK